MLSTKTKTQVAITNSLDLIVKSIMQQFPIYDVNKSVEYLIAKESRDYLDEIGLALEDLQQIEESRKQVTLGQSTKVISMEEAIKKLKQ